MSARDVIVQLVGNTFGSGDEFAEELLGALIGHGYAVVELPKPGEPAAVVGGRQGIPFRAGDSCAYIFEGGVYDGEYHYSPEQARDFAAAILAAAEASA